MVTLSAAEAGHLALGRSIAAGECQHGWVYECLVCGSQKLSRKPYETWPPPPGLVLTPPYEDLLGRPSYGVCPNCGFEFGNDDNPGTAPPVSFEQYHAEWVADGRPRFD